ncbi:uncharacterized protein MKK02DRAFT_42510 [Dioszegia hungarica]|uniref:Uncharacterized protein n=1 Tax=Dioszegia hungarica TaxID=4972 RepID=A0AA38HDM9_9TREE|nr:uncharacterized protein MKK02DRAFT_42510 [Dioszegia hungarica]KAI9638122.1 hypothetical protein MKK02DRAFT_42510 [Dioszegia hungarica]
MTSVAPFDAPGRTQIGKFPTDDTVVATRTQQAIATTNDTGAAKASDLQALSTSRASSMEPAYAPETDDIKSRRSSRSVSLRKFAEAIKKTWPRAKVLFRKLSSGSSRGKSKSRRHSEATGSRQAQSDIVTNTAAVGTITESPTHSGMNSKGRRKLSAWIQEEERTRRRSEKSQAMIDKILSDPRLTASFLAALNQNSNFSTLIDGSRKSKSSRSGRNSTRPEVHYVHGPHQEAKLQAYVDHLSRSSDGRPIIVVVRGKKGRRWRSGSASSRRSGRSSKRRSRQGDWEMSQGPGKTRQESEWHGFVEELPDDPITAPASQAGISMISSTSQPAPTQPTAFIPTTQASAAVPTTKASLDPVLVQSLVNYLTSPAGQQALSQASSQTTAPPVPAAANTSSSFQYLPSMLSAR